MRPLLLDDALPAELAAELTRRGRPARTVAQLGLAGATDAQLLDTADGLVLVTTVDGLERRDGVAIAVVTARTVAGRRDAVHRHAHAMASQRPGSLRRYR